MALKLRCALVFAIFMKYNERSGIDHLLPMHIYSGHQIEPGVNELPGRIRNRMRSGGTWRFFKNGSDHRTIQ